MRLEARYRDVLSKLRACECLLSLLENDVPPGDASGGGDVSGCTTTTTHTASYVDTTVDIGAGVHVSASMDLSSLVVDMGTPDGLRVELRGSECTHYLRERMAVLRR